MCNNFQPIRKSNNDWVRANFGVDLPSGDWRDDVYPAYSAPFITFESGHTKCDLAKFGLIPHSAIDKMNFGLTSYNVPSETISELATFRSAWKKCYFGLVLMESFYESNYEVGQKGKSIRYRIKRSDDQPCAAACIYERVFDRATGEILLSFSILTINATDHPVMKHFHKLDGETRSIVILQESDFQSWLTAEHPMAYELLKQAPNDFLTSEPAPKSFVKKSKTSY